MARAVFFVLAAVVVVAQAASRVGHRHHYWQQFVRGSEGPADQWFTQQVDHYDATQGTFQQRYQVNSTFYKPGGPLFLMLGGEGPATGVWLGIDSAIMIYAQQHNAVVAQIEHRFYGETQPFKDLSMKSLQFLSSEQALADAAVFIVALREQLRLPAATKVISFGGSYSGALSAWLRAKYPHLVDGAISTSSPVLAELNFVEYQEVVGASLATTPNGPACVDRIAAAMQQVDALLQTADGQEALTSLFTVCPNADLSLADDAANFVSTLASNFDGIVQYARDNRAFEGGPPPPTMELACDVMNTGSDALAALAAFNQMMLNASSETCTDVSYSSMVAQMRNESLDGPAANGGRQWTYQTCVEFGYYQSSDAGAKQPFGGLFPLSFSLKQCVDFFGLQGPNIDWTNTNYGGQGIKTTNTVFVNGLIDPWHILSVTSADGQPSSNKVIVMQSTAHCANMYPPSPSDPAELTAARAAITKTIGDWLAA